MIETNTLILGITIASFVATQVAALSYSVVFQLHVSEALNALSQDVGLA